MKNTIIFDADEVVVKREMYFSQRLAGDFNIPEEKVMDFFRNEYRECATGKTDLKKVLEKYINVWGWEGSVDDLLKYWFEHEREIDDEMVQEIKSLRARGYTCCLATNNESYRTRYLVNEVGLGNLFDHIFSSAEIGHLKVENDFWRHVENTLETSLTDIIVWDSDEKTSKRFPSSE
ncbi:MAG TPA: HAD family hydrolase [Candidatus Bathyarchaeia archaeon]|nr:HAD family hydrolase [Candidatus Bathyarchaeia archaeon]